MSDSEFMAQALVEARKAAALGEVPVGAIVTYQGQVVASAHNQPISGCDPSAHAEILALRKAAQHLGNYRLVGCDLYVTLEPCTMCVGAVVHSRVDRLVYGATEPKAGAVISQFDLQACGYFNHKPEIIGGVLAEDSSALISAFFARRREAKKALRQQ